MPLPKQLLKEHFPRVKHIVEATKTISIEVLPQDAVHGRRKDPEKCALAQACLRTKIAEGAIIGLSFSYLIKGDTATRYKTSVNVAREITSFDRHNEFAAGRYYKLSKVSPASTLEAIRERPRPTGPHNGTRKEVLARVHRTANVRLMR
jgi:hypothetical protein